MTDRELLELAARATRLNVCNEVTSDDGLIIGEGNGDLYVWNPLKNDGDALRLAVELGIKISPYPFYEWPKHSVMADRIALSKDGKFGPSAIEIYKDDKYAATRRAIVRAAAEIGKATSLPTPKKQSKHCHGTKPNA